MNTRRKLSREEQEEMIARLQALPSTIAESYKFPLKDLIDNLKDPVLSMDYEVEENEGVPVKYCLHFSGSLMTWKMLCGSSGIFTVDAATLKAIDFRMTLIN